MPVLPVSSTGEEAPCREAGQSHPGEKEIWVLATALTCMTGLACLPEGGRFFLPATCVFLSV